MPSFGSFSKLTATGASASKQQQAVPAKPQILAESHLFDDKSKSQQDEESLVDLAGAPLFLVSHKLVKIYEEPSQTARAVGYRREGDCIAVDSKQGPWLRLTTSWLPNRYGEALLQELGIQEAWMLSHGEDGENYLVPVVEAKYRELRLNLRLRETQELVQSRLRLREIGGPVIGLTGDHAAPVSIVASFFSIEARYEPADPINPRTWRVFATRSFAKDELVERCELIALKPGAQTSKVDAYVIQGHTHMLLPLGYFVLYRRTHVEADGDACLSVSWSNDGAGITLSASRQLEAGEELQLSSKWIEMLQQMPCPEPGPPLPKSFDSKPHVSSDVYSEALEESKRLAASQKIFKIDPKLGVSAGSVRPGWSSVHGRGVFALQAFSRKQIIDLCPALSLDAETTGSLQDYVMDFQYIPRSKYVKGDPLDASQTEQLIGVALGGGALLNHSDNPNAYWSFVPFFGKGLVALVATVPIKAGDELLISYGEKYWSDRAAKMG